jgi:hypothetical protein
MGGGLLQLVAYGAQDIYLTGNPQITFFKVVYRRYTNFSMECIQQTFNGTPGNNARVVATVQRSGDLVHDCFIKIKGDGNSISNKNNPGYNIIDSIEVEIGGQTIDKQFGHFLESYSELTQETGFNLKATGGEDIQVGTPQTANQNFSKFQFTTGAGGIRVNNFNYLYVPLQFWFNRNVGLSLPLIALQYHQVDIIINISNMYTSLKINDFSLWCNYIYLDTDERRRFAQVSHEYLIEQVQTQNNILTDSVNNIELIFNHPVKELIWVALNVDWGADETDTGRFVAPYDNTTTVNLLFNGQERFQQQKIEFFTRYQPYKYHTNVSRGHKLDTIAVYSFALNPEEHQPSGTCNFSRIDSAYLNLNNLDTPSSNASKGLYIYAINYNVLRIMSGMGGLAYSN